MTTDPKPMTAEEIEQYREYLASNDSADIVRRQRDGDDESGPCWLATIDALTARLTQAEADARVLRAEVKAWREHAAHPVGGVRELEVSAAVADTDASGAMTRGGPT